MLGFAITLAGIALLIPIGVPLVARVLLGRLSRGRRTPSLARFAAGEVLRAPGRTSFTTGAVLLSLALVVGFSITQTSYTRAFDLEFESILSADLYARTPTWRPFGSDVALDEGIADEIEEIPGVAASWPFRLMPISIDDQPVVVITYDVDEYSRYARLSEEAKREQVASARALRDPNAILASPSLLVQTDRQIGDEIELATPTGRQRLRIAGTLEDPSAVTPEIVFDYETFKRVWGVGGSDNFAVVVEDGADVAAVRASIARRLARYDLQIDTAQQYRDLVGGLVGSVTQLIGSVQLVAVIVAGLGLANTLLISTLERRRDLGVLRAVGMLRKQLRRMVAIEALLIGGLGVLLAWGLGTLIGFGMFTFLESQLGMRLPVSAYVGAAVLGLAAAVIASLYPAQRAARIDVVEALQYE
jgi:putative ABC transport system permease protein